MEKLAIIGTGIAGMGAAWFLKDKFEITVFEKNNYVGGHTNTVTVNEDGTDVFIDTGFMVLNKVTYPNLIKLFDKLEVPIKKTDMSFSVQHCESGLEYCGSGINGLFAQRKNIFNLQYIKMIFSINRFNKECLEVLNDNSYKEYSLERYVHEKGYGKDFLYKYLIPMSSAVWSTPPDLMLKFPASALIQFFYNHGFLGLDTQHQWYTVINGSQSYRDRIIAGYKSKIHTSNAAKSVSRVNGKVIVETIDGTEHFFDKVILASHADESLSLLKDATESERKLLSPFKYQYNSAILHTDSSVMPKNKKVWSSWNYRIETHEGIEKTSTIYYMNSLQQVSKKKDYFVSINNSGVIDESKILKKIDYDHPLFDLNAMQAQDRLNELNIQGNGTFFCGSYFKYGFHEDAFASAVVLSKQLDDTIKW